MSLADLAAQRCVGAALHGLREEDDGEALTVAAESLAASSPPPPPTPAGLAQSRGQAVQHPQEAAANAAGASREQTVGGVHSAPVVLRRERLAEEWHFDEDSHAAKVEDLKSQCLALRDREAAARKRAQHAEHDAVEHAQTVLLSVEEQEQELARRLSARRSELAEVRLREEDLRATCGRRVPELERKAQAERSRRAGLEAELREEPQQLAKAKQHIAKVAELEVEHMREKDRQIRAHRADAQREILELQRAADGQAWSMEQRMRQDLALLQRELDEVLRRTRGSVSAEIQHRWQEQVAAADHVSTIDCQILHGLNATHKEALDMQDGVASATREVQARDFALEALVHQHTGAALASLGCATDEKRQAAMLEHQHRQHCGAAVKALGETFPRSTQYQLHLDKKTRSAVLAASAFHVVVGSGHGDLAAADEPYWETRSRLQAGDAGRSYDDVFRALQD